MWWFSGRSAHVAVHPNLKPIMTRSCCIEWCCVWECRRRGRGLARSGRDPIWHIWVESERSPLRHVVDPRAKRFRQSNPMGRVCRLPTALRPAGGKRKSFEFHYKVWFEAGVTGEWIEVEFLKADARSRRILIEATSQFISNPNPLS